MLKKIFYKILRTYSLYRQAVVRNQGYNSDKSKGGRNMSQDFGGFLSFALGKLNFAGRYKVCERCPYWMMECKEDKYCQSRFQAEGVVWHLGNDLK